MAAPSVSGGFTEIPGTWAATSRITGVVNAASVTYSSGNDYQQIYLKYAPSPGTSYGASVNALSNIPDLTNTRRMLYCEPIVQDRVTPLNEAMTGGAYIGICNTATANNRAWRIYGAYGLSGSSATTVPRGCIVDPRVTSTAFVDAGTFDLTDPRYFCFGAEEHTTSTGYVYPRQVGYIDPYVVVGGESGNDADFSSITDYIAAEPTIANESPTKNMHLCRFIWIVGNGSTVTRFVTSLKVFEFPDTYDHTVVNNSVCHLNPNSLGFEVNASATDYIRFTLCNWISSNKFFWNVLGSSSADIIFDTCIVQGAGLVSLADGAQYVSVTFNQCGTITAIAPTFNGVTIKNAVDTVAIDVVDSSNISGSVIEYCNTGMRFDFAGSASVTLDDVTFRNNTLDIEYTGTGTLTITAINGTNFNTSSATGGGNIVILGAVIEQGLTFTNLLADSQVVIYESGTTTEIDRVNSSGTEFDWRENYTADRTADYTILKEGCLPIRVTGLSLSTTVVPIQVQQVQDRTYELSSGLTYGVNCIVNTSLKTVSVTSSVTVQNLYAALIEFWRAESALRNIKFPVVTNGPNSFTFIDGWEITSGSFQYLSRDGVRFTSGGVVTATWAAIKVEGDLTGLQAEYQQVIGSAATNAQNTGQVDQLIQVYGDASHGDFDYTNYLYIKYQDNGYYESGINVAAQFGTLEDQLYTVAIQPTAIADFTTGDPAITGVSITNHGASPVTWNGKNFSITITDTGGNTGENIQRWLNYNKSLDSAFQGFEPFNLFDMINSDGGIYTTRRGTIINSAGALLKGVRVVDGSGNPHSFFDSFTSDDGTVYTPPKQILLQAPNLQAGRIRLYNVTTATEIDNSLVTGAYNFGWVNGSSFTAGDIIRLTWASDLGDKHPIIVTTQAPANGSVTFIESPVDDVVFAQYTGLLGVGGADITEYIPDFPNLQLDINTGPGFKIMRMYIFYKWILSSEDGIRLLVGAISAIDAGKLLVDVSQVPFNLDSLAPYNVYQEDQVVIVRSDGAPVPVAQPTGGYGISMWHDGAPVVFSTSNGLSASDYALINSIAANQYTNTKLHTGLDSYANKDDWKATSSGGLDETGLHTALDNYTNKNAYKADLSPVLSAVASLPTPGDATQAKQDQLIAVVATVDLNVDSTLAATQDIQSKIGTPTVTVSDDIANIPVSDATLAKQNQILSDISALSFGDATQTKQDLIRADIAALSFGDATTANQTSILNSIAALNNLSVSDVTAATPTTEQIADTILNRNLAGGLDGGRTVKDALRANRNKVVRNDTNKTLTVYQEDDLTPAWSAAITTSELDSIDSIDPA